MCKILLWSVEHILNQNTGNFGRISNLIEVSLVECGQASTSSCHQQLAAHQHIGLSITDGYIWIDTAGPHCNGLNLHPNTNMQGKVRYAEVSVTSCGPFYQQTTNKLTNKLQWNIHQISNFPFIKMHLNMSSAK